VKHEEAGCAIERAVGCSVDGALHKADAIRERQDGLPREIEHRGRGIDASEAPVRLYLGHRLEFEPSAGADDENMGGTRCTFREKEGRHAMDVSEARHLARSFHCI
jgi:hypothetical protein